MFQHFHSSSVICSSLGLCAIKRNNIYIYYINVVFVFFAISSWHFKLYITSWKLCRFGLAWTEESGDSLPHNSSHGFCGSQWKRLLEGPGSAQALLLKGGNPQRMLGTLVRHRNNLINTHGALPSLFGDWIGGDHWEEQREAVWH